MEERVTRLAAILRQQDLYETPVVDIDYDPMDCALPEAQFNAKRIIDYTLAQPVYITEENRFTGMVRYNNPPVPGDVFARRGHRWFEEARKAFYAPNYQENLVARVYSLATWFSPADIEAPTLETIQFFDRRNETPVLLENVPPIVFSETMRDLDMMVSVAHVGGVDPEASHSTVEMRLAIAKELTALLQLNNISWRSAHALIRGKLSNYSVHLGSGIVHAEGKGMVSIVPVHTQARGRIFLPFADDDPKTAEIISKIVLLSEDHKLKDPSILCQITT